jgi:hypothetical protein
MASEMLAEPPKLIRFLLARNVAVVSLGVQIVASAKAKPKT